MTDSSHVGALSIAFMFVTLLICFGVPIGLAVWAKAKYKKDFSFLPLAGGVLGFVISQLIIRIPLISFVFPSFGWFQQLMKMQWLATVFLSYTAGLFEEPARFIVFAILRRRRQYPDGFSYGIGHGGIEAITIVGVTTINNLVLAQMINSGNQAAYAGVPASVITALTTSPSVLFLAAGLERIFAIALQIALSLLVLKGFQVNKKWLYLFIAILIHGSVNLLALALTSAGAHLLPNQSQLGSVILSEGFLLIIAILSVLFIARLAREWKRNSPDLPAMGNAPA